MSLKINVNYNPDWAAGRSGNKKWIEIIAIDCNSGESVGFVRLKREGSKVIPLEVFVKKDFRRNGVATYMYSYIHNEMGYYIKKSNDQTSDGKAFRSYWESIK